MNTPKKIKAELWQIDDLIKTWENIVTDSEFAASKNIKNPRTKRQNITHFNWSSSVLYYLNELKNLKSK